MKHSIRNLVYAAFFLALAIILPFLTAQIPSVGTMLLPMHIPALLCGFLCGWKYGLVIGFIAPLLRSFLFGMPPLFPTAFCMAFELATYGCVAGFLYARSRHHCVWAVYCSLCAAMIAGRLVYGLVSAVVLGLAGSGYSLSIFLQSTLISGIPGILLQLLLIPAIMLSLHKAKVIEDPVHQEFARHAD